MIDRSIGHVIRPRRELDAVPRSPVAVPPLTPRELPFDPRQVAARRFGQATERLPHDISRGGFLEWVHCESGVLSERAKHTRSITMPVEICGMLLSVMDASVATPDRIGGDGAPPDARLASHGIHLADDGGSADGDDR